MSSRSLSPVSLRILNTWPKPPRPETLPNRIIDRTFKTGDPIRFSEDKEGISTSGNLLIASEKLTDAVRDIPLSEPLETRIGRCPKTLPPSKTLWTPSDPIVFAKEGPSIRSFSISAALNVEPATVVKKFTASPNQIDGTIKSKKSEAQAALRLNYPNDFSYQEYNQPRLVFTNHKDEVERVLRTMQGPFFGFDLEWKPQFIAGRRENPTALVQICDERTILMVHVARMPEFPKVLRDWIEDPRNIKIGVQVGGDGNKLRRDFNMNPTGLLEINAVMRAVDTERWDGLPIRFVGLQEVTAIYTGKFLVKDSVRLQDWSAPLNFKQLRYAANDVYASLKVVKTLEKMPSNVDIASLACEQPNIYQKPSSLEIPKPATSTIKNATASLGDLASLKNKDLAKDVENFEKKQKNPILTSTKVIVDSKVPQTNPTKSVANPITSARSSKDLKDKESETISIASKINPARLNAKDINSPAKKATSGISKFSLEDALTNTPIKPTLFKNIVFGDDFTQSSAIKLMKKACSLKVHSEDTLAESFFSTNASLEKIEKDKSVANVFEAQPSAKSARRPKVSKNQPEDIATISIPSAIPIEDPLVNILATDASNSAPLIVNDTLLKIRSSKATVKPARKVKPLKKQHEDILVAPGSGAIPIEDPLAGILINDTLNPVQPAFALLENQAEDDLTNPKPAKQTKKKTKVIGRAKNTRASKKESIRQVKTKRAKTAVSGDKIPPELSEPKPAKKEARKAISTSDKSEHIDVKGERPVPRMLKPPTPRQLAAFELWNLGTDPTQLAKSLDIVPGTALAYIIHVAYAEKKDFDAPRLIKQCMKLLSPYVRGLMARRYPGFPKSLGSRAKANDVEDKI